MLSQVGIDILLKMEDVVNSLTSAPGVKDFLKRFKSLYKESSVWTLVRGCLIFSSWMVYYLIFVSPETTGVLDIIILILFLLGALLYVASSSLFTKLSRTFSRQDWIKYLKTGNKYLFMILSFGPGLYFAFKYEHFILRFYLVVHFVTSFYFLYKRYKEFELEPFLIGLAMSVGIYMVGPIIRGFFSIFGSSWFWTSCASTVEGAADLALAVTFLLGLPQKYLPSNMLFGLKLIKYFLYFLSWQTWFILMVVATWSNLGAGAQALIDTYNNIEVGGRNNKIGDNNARQPNTHQTATTLNNKNR